MKNRFVLPAVLLFAVVILQSCNVDLKDGVVVKNESQNLSYNLSENGCSTELQQYSSFASMCEGLKNESRNNFCAYNLRRAKYEAECLSQGPW